MKPAPFLLAAAVFATAVPPCCGQPLEKCDYSLAFAIPRGRDGTIDKEKSREIGEAFMALAQDASRGIAGGGRMEYDARRHVLVVSHTPSGHEHVMHLLAAIRNLIDRENGTILALARPSHVDWRGTATNGPY